MAAAGGRSGLRFDDGRLLPTPPGPQRGKKEHDHNGPPPDADMTPSVTRVAGHYTYKAHRRASCKSQAISASSAEGVQVTAAATVLKRPDFDEGSGAGDAVQNRESLDSERHRP